MQAERKTLFKKKLGIILLLVIGGFLITVTLVLVLYVILSLIGAESL